jgi:hypothetical protein
VKIHVRNNHTFSNYLKETNLLHLEQLGNALLQLFFLCLHWLQTVLAIRSRSERTTTAVVKLIVPCSRALGTTLNVRLKTDKKYTVGHCTFVVMEAYSTLKLFMQGSTVIIHEVHPCESEAALDPFGLAHSKSWPRSRRRKIPEARVETYLIIMRSYEPCPTPESTRSINKPSIF